MHERELKAERNDHFLAADALIKAARANKKDLTGAELEQYETHVSEMKRLDALIARCDQISNLTVREPGALSSPTSRANGNGPLLGRDTDGRTIPIFAKGQSVADYVRQQRGDDSEGVSLGGLIRAMCLGGGSSEIRNALSIGTDSAGGVTVPLSLLSQLVDNLRARSCMFQAGARTLLLDTGKGTTICAITGDPTAAWRAENADVALIDMTFAPITLTPKSLAVIVVASRELLEDSVNVNEALMISLAASLGGELDRVALIGAGTGSEPKGVSKVTGVGSYSVGDNGATLANYDPFVEALGILQAANAQDPTAVIVAPRTAKQINLLKDSTNQPLRRPTALENLPFLTTSKLPINETHGTSNATSRAVMGFFPDVLIGVRSELRIEILREKYADKLQYGILAHLRADIAVQHAANFCNIVGLT